jgi:hypothetical protein
VAEEWRKQWGGWGMRQAFKLKNADRVLFRKSVKQEAN